MHDDTSATVLLIEDDQATLTFLADELTADGYEILIADCAKDGLRLMESKYPDLVVLDVGLPDGSGLDLVRKVREADGLATRVDPQTPMLVLSGRGGETDRLRGFERGADDYVVKPFSYPELRSRIAALLRRADGRRKLARVRVGPLQLDTASRGVLLHGKPVELTQKEFALLRVLAAQPTRVHTKEELMRTVWGFRSMGRTRTLDSHACRLRAKLGTGGERFILNVWGVGYRLVDSAVIEPGEEER